MFDDCLHALTAFFQAFDANLRHDPGQLVQVWVFTSKGDIRLQLLFYDLRDFFDLNVLFNLLLLSTPSGLFTLAQSVQNGRLVLKICVERHMRHTQALGNFPYGKPFGAGFL